MASLSKITFLTILQEIENTFSFGEKVPVRGDEGFRKALTSALYPPTSMVHLSNLAWVQYPVNGFCDYAYGFTQNDRNDISNERNLFQSKSYFFFSAFQIFSWVNDFAVSIKKFNFAILPEWLPCPKLLFQPLPQAR